MRTNYIVNSQGLSLFTQKWVPSTVKVFFCLFEKNPSSGLQIKTVIQRSSKKDPHSPIRFINAIKIYIRRLFLLFTDLESTLEDMSMLHNLSILLGVQYMDWIIKVISTFLSFPTFSFFLFLSLSLLFLLSLFLFLFSCI